jgi:hypothetical protein
VTEPDLPAPSLPAIRERVAQATRGPWRVGRPFWRCILEHGRGPGGHGQGDCRYTFGGWMDESEPDAPAEIYQDGDFVEDQTEQGVERMVAGTVGYDGGGICSPADAEFIAHARTDVPALLAYAERLEAEVTDLRAALLGVKVWLWDSGPCWCEESRRGPEDEHELYCLAARAALEEGNDGCE